MAYKTGLRYNIELRLDLGIRGLRISSRSNLESGPLFAEVWSGDV